MIWQGDARWWPRRAPVLFPFNGWLNGGRFRAKGRTYEADVHGFGPEAVFDLTRLDARRARLNLRDSAHTRALFPYAFSLEIGVELEAAGLAFTFEVHNPADEPLPYALGFHPGFAWPFDGGNPDAYSLAFEKTEVFDIPRIAPGGLFMDEPLTGVPMDGARLLPALALAEQESLVFRSAASRRVDFRAPSGRCLRVETENFPNWVFWRRHGGAYLCIEGWSGQGDPVGFAGDITQKPGMILLPPGGRESHRFHIALV